MQFFADKSTTTDAQLHGQNVIYAQPDLKAKFATTTCCNYHWCKIGESVKSAVEKQVCSLVKKCLKKEAHHHVFDNYFDVVGHSKQTRNNNRLLRLPKIKLEVLRPSFCFGAAKIFNSLDISERNFLHSLL